MTNTAVAGGVPPATAGNAFDDAGRDREMLRRAILEQATTLQGKPGYDLKEILTQARYADAAGKALWRLVRDLRPQVLVAPGFGGAPLLYATAFAAMAIDGVELPVWMVRDQRKTYYGKRWIEGPRLAPGARAVMLDDFIGKGSGLQLVDQAMAAEGLEADVCGIAVLLDGWSPLGSRQLRVSRCPIRAVFRRHDLGITRDCHDARPPTMRGSAPALVGRPAWWRMDIVDDAAAAPGHAAPLVADGAVFATGGSALWCLDAASGETRWRRPDAAPGAGSGARHVGFVDSSLVCGSGDGTIARLDAATGRAIWRRRADVRLQSAPVVDLARRRLFVNAPGHLGAIDWDRGITLWRRPGAAGATTPACFDEAGGAVVAARDERSIECVDADTGELRWRAEANDLVRDGPALVAGCVVVATAGGWLQAFDLQTGATLRARRHAHTAAPRALATFAGQVVAQDDSAHLSAFDATDFRLCWISSLRARNAGAPARWGRWLIALSTEGHLAAIDALAGLKHWEGSIGERHSSAPGIGLAGDAPLLACKSHQSGLKAFRLDPYYRDASIS